MFRCRTVVTINIKINCRFLAGLEEHRNLIILELYISIKVLERHNILCIRHTELRIFYVYLNADSRGGFVITEMQRKEILKESHFVRHEQRVL